MKKKKLVNYILLYITLLIYSASTIFAKIAAQQDMIVKVLVFMGLEVGCLGLYAVIWQQVLKKFPLVTAMSSKGVVVIFNLIWSVLLFGEGVTLCNFAGALIIVGGIWMVSSDD